MDIKEMLFPLSLAFLASASLSLALIYFGIAPYVLLSHFLIFSVASIVVAVVLASLYFYYTWPEEPWRPYASYYSMEKSLEPSDYVAVRTNPNSQKAKTVNVDPPSREQLQQLKEVLGISRGSLQFKKRGGGIYLVTYEDQKHVWKHLGSWFELKQKLQENFSSN